MIKKILLCCILLSSTGCASMLTGTTQEIVVNTEPSGATCIIEGVGEFQTPTKITLERGNNYKITIGKQGYEPQTIVVSKSFNVVAITNVLWGVIGIIGFVVDFSNGGAYSLSPEVINITLSRKSEAIPESNPLYERREE